MRFPPGENNFSRQVAVAVSLLSFFGAAGCGESRPSPERIAALQAQGAHAQTLEPLHEALRESPGDPELNHLYGVALFGTGQPGLAIWPLRKAAEHPEAKPEWSIVLVRALLQSASAQDAFSAADDLAKAFPDLLEAREQRMQAAISLKRYDEAISDADWILSHAPSNVGALFGRIAAFVGSEKLDEAAAAMSHAEDALDESSGPGVQAKLCAGRATFANERGERSDALQMWDSCLERFPEDGLVVGGAVQFFDRSGETERSTEILELAHERNPELLGNRIAYAQRLHALGRGDEAEALLREATEGPAAPSAEVALASLHQANEDLESARDALRRASSHLPSVPPMLRAQLADLMIRLGEFDDANQQIANIDVPALAMLLRGRLMLESGRPAEALEALSEGVRLWPGNATARLVAGSAAEQLADFERAKSEYLEAIRIDGRNWEATRAFVRLLEGHAQLDEVTVPLRRYLGESPDDPRGWRLLLRVAQRAKSPSLANDAFRSWSRLSGQGATAMAEVARNVTEVRGPDACLELLDGEKIEFGRRGNAPVLAAYVEALSKRGSHEDAIKRARAALEVNPDSVAHHEIAARALLDSGAPDAEPRELLSRAMTARRPGASVLALLAEIETRAGRFEEALDLYDRAARADADDPTPAWDAIRAAVAQGDEPEVDRRLDKLLRQHRGHAPAARLRVDRLLGAGGDLEAALQLAKRAMYAEPSVESVTTLGRVHVARAELKQAIEVLQSGIEAEPTAGVLHYLLGDSLRQSGEPEAARTALQVAVDGEAFPEQEEARRILGLLGASS